MIRSFSLQQPSAGSFTATDVAERDSALVVVQPSVLSTVDHAVGNLFQRVYHLIRTARNGNHETLAVLEESVHELQALLELFVDYVAPTVIQSRPLPAADLLLSCRRHLEEEIGSGRIDLRSAELAGVSVAADPARMARVFDLLSRALRRAVGPTGLRACAAVSGDGVYFEITFERLAARGDANDEVRRALAQKLIDLQGGELRECVAPDGVQWTVRVPVSGG